jgi:hypothetical protein
VLAERGRRQRLDLERATKQLTEVYRELQDNFERMKRAERLFALATAQKLFHICGEIV